MVRLVILDAIAPHYDVTVINGFGTDNCKAGQEIFKF